MGSLAPITGHGDNSSPTQSPPPTPLPLLNPESPGGIPENGNNQSAAQGWNCNSEIHRVRSPTFGGVSVSEAYGLRHCMSVQCGRGYEGVPMGNPQVPQSLQSGSYQTFVHQHQIAVPVRAVQHHHHHPSSSGPSCHPHQPQSSYGTFPNLPAMHPHSQMERMMHSSSTNHQVRSVVMNHYSSNSSCMHHSTAPPQANGGGYFAPANSSGGAPVGGGSSYGEFNHHHHHHLHHHGPGMSSAAAANSYRAMAAAHHHHSKVINPSQAAAMAAYQNAYHQYSQYIQHQGMMHAIHNQKQTGMSEFAGWNQNTIGVPMNGGPNMSHLQQQPQAQSRLLPFMNRISSNGHSHSQPLPPFQQHHHHHHHGFPACHPHILPSCIIPNQHPSQGQAPNRIDAFNAHQQSGSTSEPMKSDGKSASATESQSSSRESYKASPMKKSRKGSSKISSTSSEKSLKVRRTKSVTKLRERHPRLVVNQKKKSVLNLSGTSSIRKHKAPSKSVNLLSGYLPQPIKSIILSTTDSDTAGMKRSKKPGKKDSEDDDISEISGQSGAISVSGSSTEKSDDEQSKPEEEETLEKKERELKKYYLEETPEEEYVPSAEEMIAYLERLNTCNNLNIPLHHAYSMSMSMLHEHEIHEIDSNSSSCNSSDCSVVDGVLEGNLNPMAVDLTLPINSFISLHPHKTCLETECLNCLTWQQQQYDICPSRPPPGFEHLTRPVFPIELCDPSLLGNLIGSQLPRGGNVQVTSPESYFEDVQEVLSSLTCCEKHAIDKIWSMKKSIGKLHEDSSNVEGSDWDCLDKAIRNVLDDWTEELYFRKKFQQILYGLNLHEVYGGCCTSSGSSSTNPPEDNFDNDDDNNNSTGKTTSFAFTPLISRDQQSQLKYFINDSDSIF